MPAKQVPALQQQTPASTGEIAAPVADVETGNAEKQEELRGKEGTSEGRESYQQALGKWLGGELYKAVAPHLTLGSLSGYANQGWAAALEGMVGLLGNVEGDVDEAAIKKFGEALVAQYGDLAGKWLESDGKGLAAGLGGWVDAHPRTIVTVALLAAAGAIAANVDTGTLKQKLKIADGLSVGVEAKLGKIRELALKEIKARLEYASGPLMAAVEVGQKDGKITGGAEVSVGDDTKKLSADAKFTEDGLDVYGVHGVYKAGIGDLKGDVTGKTGQDPTFSASITRQDGSTTVTNALTYDANNGVLSFEDKRALQLGDDTKLNTSVTGGSDGSGAMGLGATHQLNEKTSLNGGMSFTENKDGQLGKLDGGLTHKSGDLDASATGWLDSKGNGGLSGNFNKDFGGGLKGGASGSATFGEKSGFEAGGYLSHVDEEGDTLKGEYKYKSAEDLHRLDLMAEETMGDFRVRGTAGLQQSNKGKALDLGVHGAYFFNKDVAGIAGGRYSLDEKGESKFVPEVGVQVKGVPLTVSYDPKAERVSVGLSLKF